MRGIDLKKIIFLFFFLNFFLIASFDNESENKDLENKIALKFEKILGNNLENIDIDIYDNQANILIQYKDKAPKNKELISEKIITFLFKNNKNLNSIYIIITENSEENIIVYSENYKQFF